MEQEKIIHQKNTIVKDLQDCLKECLNLAKIKTKPKIIRNYKADNIC